MKPIKTTYNVQAVDKAFEMLEILAEHDGGLSVAHLAAQTGLNRNKAFRLAATLCDRGLVEQEQGTGVYRLGICSVALAQKFLRNANLVNYAHPLMEELARKHGEAVYMTVIKDDEVVFVDMVDCDRHIKAAPLVGKKFPFATTAPGKVLKAPASRELREKLLTGRTRRGDAAALDQLETELDEIRTSGIAIDQDALGDGISSVAVAVRDYAGMVIGALTMLGPSFRMLQNRLEQEIIPSLCEYAEILSMKFGYAKVSA